MQIQVNLKTALITAGVILVAMIALVAFWTINKNSYEARIVKLQNDVASRDTTIETQKDVYQKLSIQANDLSKLLDSKDDEVKRLKDQLDKTGAQLLTATTLVVKLKKDLESSGNVVIQPPNPEYPSMVVAQLDSKTDFDPFRVTGSVAVDCSLEQEHAPKGTLKLSQTRALKLSVVVSQDKDGTWRSSTSSSESNFQVDIGLSAVNPYMLEPKWYEKISLGIDLGVGTNPGLLGAVGAAYKIGKFEVGPKVWVVVDRGVSPYFGAQLLWHPFQK